MQAATSLFPGIQTLSCSAIATVRNSHGLHARPAAILVKAANTFSPEVTLSDGEEVVSAKSILGTLLLGAGKGTVLEITALGGDAREAVLTLCNLVDGGFGEPRPNQDQTRPDSRSRLTTSTAIPLRFMM